MASERKEEEKNATFCFGTTQEMARKSPAEASLGDGSSPGGQDLVDAGIRALEFQTRCLYPI